MEVLVGRVIGFYRGKGVASIQTFDRLEVGNLIHIKGHTTDFDQVVESLQVSHHSVTHIIGGQIAGIRTSNYVRKNDSIYRIDK